MGNKHVVRFEPVGIEIEVDEEQNVLRAAAEQGIMLMHGCKEGQCSSCKSFLLDGDDVELDKYSTFALPDFERDEGFTLLCRAHVYEDVVIELLNYDEEMIRSGLPIQDAVAEVVANHRVTHDMRHLILRLVDTEDFKLPGSAAIAQRVLAGARPGAIFLMHDAGGNRAETAAALPEIVRGLRAKGYKLVTVPKLLLDNPPPRNQQVPASGSGG